MRYHRSSSAALALMFIATVLTIAAVAAPDGSGKVEAPCVGIDLGTTYSVVGIWQKGEVHVVPNEMGNRITPSFEELNNQLFKNTLIPVQKVNDKEKLGSKLDASDKKAIEEAVKEAINFIDENPNADKEEYKAALERLQSVSNPIIQKAYSGGEPEPDIMDDLPTACVGFVCVADGLPGPSKLEPFKGRGVRPPRGHHHKNNNNKQTTTKTTTPNWSGKKRKKKKNGVETGGKANRSKSNALHPTRNPDLGGEEVRDCRARPGCLRGGPALHCIRLGQALPPSSRVRQGLQGPTFLCCVEVAAYLQPYIHTVLMPPCACFTSAHTILFYSFLIIMNRVNLFFFRDGVSNGTARKEHRSTQKKVDAQHIRAHASSSFYCGGVALFTAHRTAVPSRTPLMDNPKYFTLITTTIPFESRLSQEGCLADRIQGRSDQRAINEWVNPPQLAGTHCIGLVCVGCGTLTLTAEHYMNWLRDALKESAPQTQSQAPQQGSSRAAPGARFAVRFAPSSSRSLPATSSLPAPLAPTRTRPLCSSPPPAPHPIHSAPVRRYGGGLVRLSELQEMGAALTPSATTPRQRKRLRSPPQSRRAAPPQVGARGVLVRPEARGTMGFSSSSSSSSSWSSESAAPPPPQPPTRAKPPPSRRAGKAKRRPPKSSGQLELAPDGSLLPHHWYTVRGKRIFVYGGTTFKGMAARRLWDQVKAHEGQHGLGRDGTGRRPPQPAPAKRTPERAAPRRGGMPQPVLGLAAAIALAAGPRQYAASERSQRLTAVAAPAVRPQAPQRRPPPPLPIPVLPTTPRGGQLPARPGPAAPCPHAAAEVIELSDSDEDVPCYDAFPVSSYFDAPAHTPTPPPSQSAEPTSRGGLQSGDGEQLSMASSWQHSSAAFGVSPAHPAGIDIVGLPAAASRRLPPSRQPTLPTSVPNAYVDCYSLDALDGMDLEGMLDTGDEMGGQRTMNHASALCFFFFFFFLFFLWISALSLFRFHQLLPLQYCPANSAMGSEVPPGRWAIVRADNQFIYLPAAAPSCVLGREPSLPATQQLRHKYVSRQHITFTFVSPGVLRVEHHGKNPTFVGATCERLPIRLQFEVDGTVSAPQRDGEKVRVPPLPFTAVGALQKAPRDEASLYFPDGLHLPDIHVAYESHAPSADAGARSAASATLSVAQMLAVPGLSKENLRTPPPPPPVVPVPAPVPIPDPPTPQLEPQQAPYRAGEWVWKSRTGGDDNNPRSWRPYPRAVQELLEKAYRDGQTVVSVPDALMKGSGATHGKSGATYGVCFAERSLKGGMIQYQLSQPGRFRVVRRNGGDSVPRDHIKPVAVIPEASSSDESSAGSSSSSFTESSSVSSLSSSVSSESSSPRKRRIKKRRTR
eukprot:gene8295-5812_t